ncbi:uncharacterized protein si:ch1073-126c3.2 [Centropristis striata]|uniref:uncharacterized protein si:ch1073-126c3.2 n=1 Tax=Centropristis striata TaxID=184440 RepID=UPI0027DF72DD|nr:uncharacterized protein si:ch1073-126c3.2 [Centropristis striata]
MALMGTIIWLLSLAVLSSSKGADETLPQNCSLNTQLLENLKVAVECGDKLQAAWSPQQTAEMLLSMRNVADVLHKQQLKECHGTEPQKCHEPEVPENGGLACVTVADRRFCKPLCSHGYDFGFLRISRVYEECSKQTQFQWQTQYIGGNKLAVCNVAPFQVAGVKTAYFPKDQDCLTTKSNIQLYNSTIADLTTELQNEGIQGELQYDCLVCG